eukprot:CAMPEP_0172545294 /NCGR_PEP_ID=MMETSP1067-20121228/15252_1 /TAXON_ID=265564 ORGANISM="Thalassiosira punctigera, Strain Tpunct2005C2" /NCGR_SAMPLE_ID=MMETSP1067 /ASSEMBLY_ACC=CAM_ASM_000444 /LENGTH=788 /DNA_ID=CAMNT_0013332011 /DNA_START=108 /DNA_END=2474 /DNA_ORIENTATION=+
MSTIEKRKSAMPPPLGPSSLDRNSGNEGGGGGEVDLAELRQRFDRQLPKYGFLWRSMADARLTKEAAKGEGGGEKKSKRAAGDKENEDPTQRRRQPRAAAAEVVADPTSGSETNDASEEITGGGRGGGVVSDESESRERVGQTTVTLLDAILNKRPVSLRVPPSHDRDLCGESCEDCADPIIEVDDEDASAYDVDADEELVDTDDDGGEEEGGEEFAKEGVDAEKDGDLELEQDVDDESVRIENEYVADDDGESDESVLIISKTPKRKKNIIIDSDEEGEDDDAAGESIESEDQDDGESIGSQDTDDSIIEGEDDDAKLEEEGRGFILSDVSVESQLIHSSSDEEQEEEGDGDDDDVVVDDAENGESAATSDRRYSTRRRGAKAKSESLTVVDDNSEKSSSSEEEWVEISSDDDEEEGDVEPRHRINTIVILSSDEEDSESEVEGDDRSAFTLSDGSVNEESVASDTSDDFRRTPSSREPRRNKTTTAKKKTKMKGYATPKENVRPNNSHAKSAPGSTLTLAFRKNRDALTSHTFAEFDQKAFRNALSSVRVTWSNKLNTTAGVTRLRGRLGDDNAHTRVATIELATKVIDDEDRLRSTLLHEMCHAAQWLVDGVLKPPHGRCFKKWASTAMRRIGDVEVTTTHDYQIAYKFAWACTAPSCTVVIKRHSRSVDPTKHCCGRCQGKLIEIEVPGSRGDTATTGHTAKKHRKASGFALFVKDHSADAKERLARERKCMPKEVSQADVMKECGRLWRSRKEEAPSSSNGGEEERDGLESMADRLVNMTLND